MRVLALDTTTRTGSTALVVDDRIVDERAGDPSRTHAERLPGEITELLGRHGLRTADVDVFAVASGPGSFTGLRIGIATVQGLAFVHHRPVAAVSALEALAHVAATGLAADTLVAVWMDAHRREVFSALYHVRGAAFSERGVAEIEGPAVGAPDGMLAAWEVHMRGRRVAFIGDGAELYAGAVDAAGGALLPTGRIAGAIGRLASARARAGTVTGPGGIQPLYVRRPDAEVARDAERGRIADHADGLAR